jgi:hypothetical protein
MVKDGVAVVCLGQNECKTMWWKCKSCFGGAQIAGIPEESGIC